MKILIVSDTHGLHNNFDKVLEIEKPFDMLIHLGDVEGGDEYIRAMVDCPIHIVEGNNDYFSGLPREEQFDIAGHHVFITHGHAYFVSMGARQLVQAAKTRSADIVMFGHIHMPVYEEVDGVTVINPGSLAYPRQKGRRPTYAVMNVTEDGQVDYEFKEL